MSESEREMSEREREESEGGEGGGRERRPTSSSPSHTEMGRAHSAALARPAWHGLSHRGAAQANGQAGRVTAHRSHIARRCTPHEPRRATTTRA
eukprot:scaffold313633_cov31-Tisochrysis_lutea.AAC.1